MAIQDGWSQASQREHMEYFDQHGRKWYGWGDVKAKLHPASHLTPAFNAPWLPNQGYARFGIKNPTRFTWDYDAMLADGRKAEKERRDLEFAAAAHFNVPNWNPDRDPPTPQMLRDIGPGPLPLDPVRAARAGNGFILGLRPFDPSRPGDVKLAAALAMLEVNTHRNDNDDEFADDDVSEFAETETPAPVSESAQTPAPRRRGRPTNAERAARLAGQGA